MPKPGATPAGYVLPRRPRWQGGWNLKSVFAAALAFGVVSFGATEWLAAALSNPVELGEPLFVYREVGVFHPFEPLSPWFGLPAVHTSQGRSGKIYGLVSA